jgi:60 kDa SS-A/Ro ribonucleoprotein
MSLRDHLNPNLTPQTSPLPGRPDMVPNSAGGYVFAVDDWQRLARFLLLGSDGGTYYASEKKITLENAACVQRCLAADGKRTVDEIVAVSVAGRAPRQNATLLAFAMALKMADAPTRTYAVTKFNEVVRTGYHLFQMAANINALGGWGRSTRRAFSDWYLKQGAHDLAYQVTKYQAREGWSQRDVLRCCHPKTENAELNAVLGWAVGHPKEDHPTGATSSYAPIEGLEAVRAATNEKEVARLIVEYGLVRETIPTEWLNSATVWDYLLLKMPMGAMLRNLGKMSAVGLLKPMGEATKRVVEQLGSAEHVKKSRLHPINVLIAMRTYASGHGVKGSLTWSPCQEIVDALNDTFYASFVNVTPTGRNHYLGVDVSGSMSAPISGFPISAREAAVAMAMATVRTEPYTCVMGFQNTMTNIKVSKTSRLDDVLAKTSRMPFGPTDCAQPMLDAMARKIEVDTFVIYTDNETWHGRVHPCVALKQYREMMGRPAKLIVAGMTSTGFTIADPTDAGMLDLVGFDPALPAVIAGFLGAPVSA